MASISTSKTNRTRTLLFVLDGKRKSIWLGSMAKRDVVTWKGHVEELVAAKMQNDRAPYDETSRWVAGLDKSRHRKLVNVGLVEPRRSGQKVERPRLAAFLDSYITGRSDVKDGTATVYGHTKRCLVEYFGTEKTLESITPADADDWRRWLMRAKNDQCPQDGGQGLSENTARRRCGIAKQFFRAAVRRRLIAENPFADLKGIGIVANRERDYFVSRDEAARVLKACPDAQWQLLFALSRYCGLRCPSEHLGLRWGDVDWERGRIVVRSPKTEHHEGKANRSIPLFPELRPYLEAVRDELLVDFDPKLNRLSEQPVITR